MNKKIEILSNRSREILFIAFVEPGNPQAPTAEEMRRAVLQALACGADLTGAHLWLCDLSNADLRQARFDQCDFTAANFSGADLRGASFAHANLANADFTGANLESADFQRAHMYRTKGVSEAA